jgi:hypothetical protein
MQIVPTGIGINPFAFYPAINAAIGTTAPYSVAHMDDQGRELAVYLGQDNVYIFDGSSVEPIGDFPISDGSRRRLGARSKILSDATLANPTQIVGFVTYSINSYPFRAYWLAFPGVSLWVFNFDEGNWTYFTYADVVTMIGDWYTTQNVTIASLIGTIQSQRWTPATLPSSTTFEGILLGFVDGVTSYANFQATCERVSNLTSGKLIFADRRHKKSVKRFRLSFTDLQSTTFNVTITNEQGQNQVFTFTVGTGSGDVLNYIQEFRLPGLRFTYNVQVPANQYTSLVELAPIYDTGGEQRCGLVEN